MRRFSTLCPLVVFIALLFSSCQKEPSAGKPSGKGCQLTKAYYFDDSGGTDSLVHTYMDDKLTKIANADGYYTFQYTGNKITRRNHFETGYPDQTGYDLITYNADGSLAAINTYYDYGGQVIHYLQYNFIYTDAQLVKFEVKEYDFITDKLELSSSAEYTYTGNNITLCKTTDHSMGTTDTYTYDHDDNPNSYAKNNPILVDLAFIDGIEGAMLPFALSRNNIKTVYYDGDADLITYKLDGQGNLYELYFYGELAARYFYDCE